MYVSIETTYSMIMQTAAEFHAVPCLSVCTSYCFSLSFSFSLLHFVVVLSINRYDFISILNAFAAVLVFVECVSFQYILTMENIQFRLFIAPLLPFIQLYYNSWMDSIDQQNIYV